MDLANKSEFLSNIYVTTDDLKIVECVDNYNKSLSVDINIIKRPTHLSDDGTTTEETLIHAIGELKKRYNYIVLLPPTAPFRRLEDLDGLIKKTINHGADSGQTISAKKIRIGEFDDLIFQYTNDSLEINMKNLSLKFYENSSAYIFKTEVLIETGRLQGSKNIGYLMDSPFDLDINTQLDWDFAEFIIDKEKYND